MIEMDRDSSAARAALDKYLQLFLRDNPKSQIHHERASKVLPAGITRAVFTTNVFPIYADAGHDVYLRSIDGHEYLDFVSQYFASMFGHSHPEIKKAVSEVLDAGFTLGAPNPKETELAETLVSRFPSMEMIQFTNSGTESNTMAIALGLNYTQKKKVSNIPLTYKGDSLAHAFVTGSGV